MRATAPRKGTHPARTFAMSSTGVTVAPASAWLEIAGVPVDAMDLLQHLDLLADRRVGARAFEERGHELAVRLRRVAQPVDGLAPPPGVPLPADLGEPLDLPALHVGVDAERRDARPLFGDVLVDADDDLLAVIHLLLEVERRLGDLPLRVAALDGLDHAAHPLDGAQVALEALLHAVGEVLEVVRPRERIGRVGDSRLVRDDLLRAERERDGLLGRECVGLVERVRVWRVRPAEHRRPGLDRAAPDAAPGRPRG